MGQNEPTHVAKKKKVDSFRNPCPRLTQLQGYQNWRKPQGGRTSIEAGDSGVFVTCDIGKEGKCIAETLDLFSQVGSVVSMDWSGPKHIVSRAPKKQVKGMSTNPALLKTTSKRRSEGKSKV